jgi:hypothetical protein
MEFNRILAVHNKYRFMQPVTWLSLVIRAVTCSRINHIAIEYTNDEGERRVIESIGKGVVDCSYEEWFTRSDREVLELFVDKDVIEVDLEGALKLKGDSYGFLDLIQILLWIIRTKWLGVGNDWNGVDGVYKWKGIICSELGGVVIKHPTPYLLMPSDFPFLKGIIIGNVFKTKKGVK